MNKEYLEVLAAVHWSGQKRGSDHLLRGNTNCCHDRSSRGRLGERCHDPKNECPDINRTLDMRSIGSPYQRAHFLDQRAYLRCRAPCTCEGQVFQRIAFFTGGGASQSALQTEKRARAVGQAEG